MTTAAAVCVVIALACFVLGAAGIPARVTWDQAGKAARVAAALAQWGPWGHGWQRGRPR